MTDRQIACAYLYSRLSSLIPDHHDLRHIAAADLSEERCYRIVEIIHAMLDRMRSPLARRRGKGDRGGEGKPLSEIL